jgi:hypothetical protein
VSPLKKNEKKTPVSFRTIINGFEGSCGTFGEEKKPVVINNIGSIYPPPPKKTFIYLFIYK